MRLIWLTILYVWWKHNEFDKLNSHKGINVQFVLIVCQCENMWLEINLLMLPYIYTIKKTCSLFHFMINFLFVLFIQKKNKTHMLFFPTATFSFNCTWLFFHSNENIFIVTCVASYIQYLIFYTNPVRVNQKRITATLTYTMSTKYRDSY